MCQNFAPPPGFGPSHLQALVNGRSSATVAGTDSVADTIVPFLSCGDLGAWDSDMTYDLPEDEAGSGRAAAMLQPVQPPIAPHYKAAIERAKQNA